MQNRNMNRDDMDEFDAILTDVIKLLQEKLHELAIQQQRYREGVERNMGFTAADDDHGIDSISPKS